MEWSKEKPEPSGICKKLRGRTHCRSGKKEKCHFLQLNCYIIKTILILFHSGSKEAAKKQLQSS
jgi:hypothetical protein